MSDSIRLSEKHGLNPSITTCFYCGKDAGIILPGLAGEKMAKQMGHSDGQMPMHCGVIDMTPCSECEDFMKKGVILIGVKDGEEGSDNPYRTGEFFVVKDRFIEDLLENNDKLKDTVLKQRFVFMPQAVMEMCGLIDKKGELCHESN